MTSRHFFLEMNVFDMLADSCFSIELLATKVANESVFARVMKHVSFELSVLNEAFAANPTNMISTSSVLKVKIKLKLWIF
jgi:hypothetical protein